MLALMLSSALAGEFMDIAITTALQDTNLRAGPEYFSPGPNFVMRGNQTFFENYEGRYTDDISQGHLVLYRRDDGFRAGWWTEAAFVLQYSPYLDPDSTRPGIDLRDDGSYVRVEAADELSAEFNDAPLRVGGYADLVVDLSTALGDQGVPQGADVSLFLNVEVKVAGEVLMLDDISLPIRIP